MRWQPRGPVQSLDARRRRGKPTSSTLYQPVGWMTGVIWQKTAKTLVDQNAMKQTIDATKAFNNQYVSAANTLKR
jgi:hypothetical protein